MSSVASRAVRKMTGASGAVGAQPPAHLEAVEVGEHHVEQQHVGPERPWPVERLPAGGRLGDVHLGVAQGGDEQVADVLLVVDDEDAGRAGGGGAGGMGNGFRRTGGESSGPCRGETCLRES